MSLDPLRLFALSDSRTLGDSIGIALGSSLSAREERDFEDDEHKTRSQENVRGGDVFVI
jgi:ribose-phosphate pyrophosphokinase